MKKLNLTMFFLSLVCMSFAQTGVDFAKGLNWSQIKEKAKKEQKFILVNAYATWCVPCKQMSNETFTNDLVGESINSKFISVKVQMDQTLSDSEVIKDWYADAKSIDKKYNVAALRAILFLTPDRELVHTAVGFIDDKGYAESVGKMERGGVIWPMKCYV